MSKRPRKQAPKAKSRVETIRIGMLGQGDPERLAFAKHILRIQEAEGLFTILFMDDEEALVAWTDRGLASPLSGGKP